MIDLLSLSSMLSGAITNIATGVILDKKIIPAIKNKELKKELEKIINVAINKTAGGKFAEYFTRPKGRLDYSFWENEEVKNELWGTLTDIHNIESIPDFNKLYEMYFKIYQRGQIDNLSFKKVIDKFWSNFLNEAKKSTMLSPVFERKILFLLDETVYPTEGLEMIREYCQNIKERLEKRIYNKFRPKTLDEFSEEKIKKEFFNYKRTQMAYLKDIHESEKTEYIIKGEEYLKEDKLIIVGDGGVGKTRFMLELEKRLVSDIAASDTEPEYLPVYIEANEFNNDNLIGAFRSKIEEGLNPQRYTDRKINGFLRYLKNYKKLFALIDAFDQISPGKETLICKILSSDALLGRCKCFITTRSYRIKQLLDFIKANGMDEKQFKLAKIQPFTIDELSEYFSFNKSLINKFKSQSDYYFEDDEEDYNYDDKATINLIRIPMFAELVKIMAMRGRLVHEEIKTNNRSWLLNEFVEFTIEEQVKKDKVYKPEEDKTAEYYAMIHCIEELSLKTLEANPKQIYKFDREYAIEVLGDDYRKYWPLMIRAQFVFFLDYESMESEREEEHRFRHQIFQEYFAARRLYRHRKYNKNLMCSSMEKMEYMSEVGRYLSEIIEIKTSEKQAKEEFIFWQSLLTANNNEDWVRTYALQVRDKLGETRAKEFLKELFEQENEELRSKAIETSDNMILIPKGKFLMGSYEDSGERPVRWFYLDEYEIDKYPVTNEAFIDFLNSSYKEKQIWKYKETPLPEYKRHPVKYITWFIANAYCKWKGINYRLPTEAEMEKAARGIYGRRYPWGNTFDTNKLNTYPYNPWGGKTSPVDKYSEGVSPYGCYDMAGNVWELTDSWNDRNKIPRFSTWFGNEDVLLYKSNYSFNYNLYCEQDDWDPVVGFRCVKDKS